MEENAPGPPPPKLLAIIGPGLLVAATGVGAGDLATASFAGSRLGTGILWAVVVGGFLKFVLTEGLARWQLTTGETLIEGTPGRLAGAVSALFPAGMRSGARVVYYFLVGAFLLYMFFFSAWPW